MPSLYGMYHDLNYMQYTYNIYFMYIYIFMMSIASPIQYVLILININAYLKLYDLTFMSIIMQTFKNV